MDDPTALLVFVSGLGSSPVPAADAQDLERGAKRIPADVIGLTEHVHLTVSWTLIQIRRNDPDLVGASDHNNHDISRVWCVYVGVGYPNLKVRAFDFPIYPAFRQYSRIFSHRSTPSFCPLRALVRIDFWVPPGHPCAIWYAVIV